MRCKINFQCSAVKVMPFDQKEEPLDAPSSYRMQFFSPLPIIKWVETEAKKLSKLRNQSRHTSVHADWPIYACHSHRGLYQYKGAFMVRSIIARKSFFSEFTIDYVIKNTG